MRILVTGAAGKLGQALDRAPRPAGAAMVGLDRRALDITDAAQVARALAEMPCRLVVNAAAHTAVDRAEAEPDAAFAVNRDGAAILAAACAARGLPLIHVSTDYVFDGAKPAPYGEDDRVAPLSVYGASKAAGEAAIRAALPEHVILRVSWVFGGSGPDFVRAIAAAARAGSELRVVDDQIGAPTHVDDIAAAIWALAARIDAGTLPWGTYHYAASGAATRFEWARQMLVLMGEWGYKVPGLRPAASADFPRPARRPANSRLDCAKFDAVLGLARPHWTARLAPALRRVLDDGDEGS